MLIFSQGTNITVMSFRHSSRVKLVVLPLALLAFQTIHALAQDLPTGLTASDITSTSAKLSWSGGGPKYDVVVSGPSGVIKSSSGISQQLLTVTSLSPGTTYDWQVRSKSANGKDSSGWATSSFTTLSVPPSQPPAAPSGLTASQITADGTTLSWSGSTGATSYNVQLSEREGFQGAIEITGVTGTSTSVTGLLAGTKYYWRVSATNAVGTSGWSASSTFTTLSTKPAAPTSLQATNITATSVTLDWSVISGAISHAFEVATDGGFKQKDIVKSGSTNNATVTVTDLLAGTKYYWRVNVTTSGGTSDWSTTSSFTTASSKPPAPTGLLSSPGSTSAVLTWNQVTGATTYDVEVATKNNFGNSVVESVSSQATTVTVGNLQPSTQYYWHVRATTSTGTSDYSEAASFETKSAALAPPALIYPDNNARNIPTSVVFQWTASTGATSYDVQWATDKKFEAGINHAGGIVGTSHAPGALSGSTDYYWRVKANGAQGSSNWSGIWSFSTEASSLRKPSLTYPSDKSSNVSTSIRMEWVSVLGATSYDVQWSTDKQFGSNLSEVTGITTPFYDPTGLLSNTTYYWKVRAKNAQGPGDWSGAWSFTTVASGLGQPSLVSPDDREKEVSTSPTLEWTAVSGVTSYTLQYSTESKFGDKVVEIKGISSTSHQLVGLLPKQTYYWRVLAVGLNGTSDWSSSRSFTTGSSQLFTPQLVSPDDRAKNVPTNVTLQWVDVGGAQWYAVQYSTDKKFVDNVSTIDNITKTLQELTGLLPNTTYYWRVQAKDPTNSSAWSATWEFTTGSSRLAVPALSQPEDKAKDVPTNVSFEWMKAEGASAYDLQYSTDRKFSGEAVTVESIEKLSYSVTKLQQNTSYYWRVRARDSNGPGDWSSDWQFKTGSSSLAAPNLHSPEYGAKGVSTSPTLSWGTVSGATSYNVQVILKNKVVSEITGLLVTSLNLNGLLRNETYSWKVQAKTADDSSLWSAEWKFTTGSSALATPTLLSPPDGKTGESTTPMLSWTFSAGSSTAATFYTVQFAKDRNFKKEPVEVSGISQSSCTLGQLATQETYFWRVRAYTWTDSSDWTEAWSFKTGSGRLGAPTLLSPFDKADAPLNPTLRWSSSVGATSYSVQVWQPQHSGAFVVNVSGLTSTSLTVLDLEHKQKYYWRVRAVSPQDSSDWTPEWSFTVSSGVTDVQEISLSIPSEFKLSQNYPNPFNPTTTIEFSTPRSTHVRIVIYSTLGHLVHTLVDENLSPGTYRKQWVAAGLASGVYFYRIQAGTFVDTKRLLLLK